MAAVIVDAQGPAALSLTRIATELGVAVPSLYKHVAGLDDLTSRVATLSISRLADALTAAALGRSGRQALHAISNAYRRFAVDHAGQYSFIQAAPRPGVVAQQDQAARAADVVGAIVKSYRVPDELLNHAIRMVRAALHGFVDIEARGGFQLAESVDESFLMLVDALDASLSALRDRLDCKS